MLPLGNIIRQHVIDFHCYADDTQLYLSMKPDETNRLVRLQACLKDIKTWMSQNCLLLNSDKTEVVVFVPERFRGKLSSYIVSQDDISLASSTTVRNLISGFLNLRLGIKLSFLIKFVVRDGSGDPET